MLFIGLDYIFHHKFHYSQTGGNQAGGARAKTKIPETGRGEGGDQVCNQRQGGAKITSGLRSVSLFQYNLEKPTNEDFEEEEDDEDYGAARKVEEPEEDPIEGIMF